MKKLTLKAISLLLLLCCNSLSGIILPLEEISRLEHEAGQLDTDSLVLFDVDFTLIIPKDVTLGPRGEQFTHKLISNVSSGKYPMDLLFGKVLATTEFMTVDQKSVGVVQELQKRGIPVLAFTAAESGKLGEIESFADFRFNQLKVLNFDFRGTFPETEFLQLSKSGTFKSGILYSCEHPKGDTLKQFLAEFPLSPKKIVFIDDRMDYLESVDTAMNELGIEFIGFHYSAAEKLPQEFDEKLATFQFRHLAEHGEWLSDEKASALLKARPIE